MAEVTAIGRTFCGSFSKILPPHRFLPHRSIRAATLAAILICVVFLYVAGTHVNTATTRWSFSASDNGNAQLGKTLGTLLEQYRPSDNDPPWEQDRFDSEKWDETDGNMTMTDRLKLDTIEILKMRDAHNGFTTAVDKQLPQYVAAAKPRAGHRGIVTIGGGKYFPILMVSLRFLRRTGTSLPVEVFVLESEYEEGVCEKVLPLFNAACRVFPPLLGSRHASEPLHLEGFQLKTFAILFSSFTDVLFLDADCTALRDLAPLFESKPFRGTGLVAWPDLWQTTVSPLYYLIASQPIVPVSQRASTESGQLLVSKERHWKTLLLAAYYNYYGPAFYYRLLNQGGTGMGDKETFLPAAAAAGQSFYQVHKPVVPVGHRFEDGGTGSRVQVQYDAIEDYAATEGLQGTSAWNTSVSYADVRPLFLHLSWPKWDATILLDHISKWSDMTVGVDGKPEPAFHYPPEKAAEIRGSERMLWEEATWTVCHLHDRLQHWKDNQKAATMCGRLEKHFHDVLDADEGISLGLGPSDVLAPKLPEKMLG